MAKESVKLPRELVDKAYEAIEIATHSGKIRRGTNETTKSIERSEAKLVVIAEDVEPAEVVMHLPIICDEKKIPYVFVPNKKELGKAAGIDVPAAAIAIANEGESKALIKEIVSKVAVAKKGA